MIAPQILGASKPNGREHERAIKQTIRCAIYTRKSSEEGLEQAFNSLDAQRDAGEAYVASLRGEGWVALSDRYDDGGYSGGSMDHRPALRRLLQDIKVHKVDCVVVYKVDRLSRSLLDFARLMGLFNEQGVSFASVTERFSSSDPVGKLTLHLLMTFSEFERSLAVQRTRDKVHAARGRGKFTGGTPILGFNVRDGRLVVDEEEAARVRRIFRLYEERQSLTRVVEELSQLGWTTKSWIRKDGTARLGRPFDKPSLLRLLRNPLYSGRTRCNGSLVAGEHRAIVDEATWNRANTHLRHNGATGGKAVRNKHGALLRGLLFCGACGYAMTHSFTKKGDVLYRYYVCVNRLKKGAHACPGGKVSAHQAERQVVDRIREIGRDPELVAETVRQVRIQLAEKRKLLETERRQLARDLGHQKAALKRLLGRASGNGDLADRVAEVQGRIRTVDSRQAAIGQEIAAAKGREIDEHDVARALEAFGPVWESLWPTERSRILGLLVEGIDHDGRDQGLAIRFRSDGVAALAADRPS